MAQDIYNLIHFLDAQRKTYSVELQKIVQRAKTLSLDEKQVWIDLETWNKIKHETKNFLI